MTNILTNVPETILMVEDDSNDVLLVRRAFRKAGINTKINIVSDGEEAINYLTRKGKYKENGDRYPMPTLILLDLKLPRVNGLEVLEWLRQQPELKRLLVVVLTSSQENPDLNKAYDLGVNSYLVKPVSFDSLVNLMDCLHAYWFNCNEKPVILANGR